MTNRFFGYIEGYYGRMLSWKDRSLILETMRTLSLNAYLYAPKEDPYHRNEWRTFYPRQWIAAFSSFVKNGYRAGVSVIPGIAPGLSYDYCSAADYATLFGKCAGLAETGARILCLLMDDIPARLPAACEKAFPSLGAAHGKLLCQLLTDLKKMFPGIGLWFCPTIYADELIKQDRTASNYLSDLAKTMPPSVIVLWTGPQVISREISASSIQQASKFFGRNVCIWDNLYANDYCPRRLFIGSYKNRSVDALETARGILLNPTGLVNTDLFLLSLLSGFANKIGPEKAWKQAVETLPVAKELKIAAPYFDLPFAKVPSASLTPRNLARVKKALKKLVWEWKSPLQREWYPFLYSLESDIALLECGPGKKRREWIRKKYPPILADILDTDAA
jgi:hyaluronoglucosaminidase